MTNVMDFRRYWMPDDVVDPLDDGWRNGRTPTRACPCPLCDEPAPALTDA